MMTLLISLAVFAAYYAAGLRFAARRYVRRRMIRKAADYGSPSASQLAKWREEAVATSLIMNLSWPFYLGFSLAFGYVMDTTPLTDAELEAEIARRDRRIEELEANDRAWRKRDRLGNAVRRPGPDADGFEYESPEQMRDQVRQAGLNRRGESPAQAARRRKQQARQRGGEWDGDEGGSPF